MTRGESDLLLHFAYISRSPLEIVYDNAAEMILFSLIPIAFLGRQMDLLFLFSFFPFLLLFAGDISVHWACYRDFGLSGNVFSGMSSSR